MTRTILLTGTRAPVTLDLARRLHRDGVRVIGADSCRFPVGRFSRAFSAHFRVPSARWEGEGFVEELLGIVSREGVDLVWPTCEEIFRVAAGRDRFPCPVLLPANEVLYRLHDKLRFALWVRELGGEVTAPPSWEASQAPADEILIWKAKHSRFGTRVRTECPRGDLGPWMAQRRLTGPEFCAWALCQSGKIHAWTQYRCPVRTERGAGYCFEPVWSEAVADFVERVVRITNYTGSIAFDFLGPAQDGRTYVLECNPRMTSGLHLLSPEVSLRGIGAGAGEFLERSQQSAQMVLLTLLRAPGLADPRRDVVGRRGDCWPFFGQLISLAEFGFLACRRGISLSESTTWDLEYNGD
jgi:hypothetical protein